MKTVSSAQADFRANDRDGNGVAEFWRKDIAGLYTLVHKADRGPDPLPIALIELSVAGADDRPITDIGTYTTLGAKAGYWYRALRFENEDSDDLDPNQFAACAYPDRRSAGRKTFSISHWNTVYSKDLSSRCGLLVYPANPVKAGWQKLD